MKWFEAVKQWNTQKGGKYVNPRKGTPEYAAVKAIVDAAPKAPKKKKLAIQIAPGLPVSRRSAAPKPKAAALPKPAAAAAAPRRQFSFEEAVRKALPTAAPTLNTLMEARTSFLPQRVPIQMESAANLQQTLQRLRLQRARTAKRNEAVAAVEQIGKRIKENPDYFNQKIDELKDVYVATHARPVEPQALEEWRDDLKIWMWSQVAALNPPSLSQLPQSMYQNIMEFVPEERLELNLSRLPETAMRNIESMAIPPLWAKALKDERFREFMDEYSSAGGGKNYEGFFNPADFFEEVTLDGQSYYLLDMDSLPVLTGFEEFDEYRVPYERLNEYFNNVEIEHFQFDVEENEQAYRRFWNSGAEQWTDTEVIDHAIDDSEEVMNAYREYYQDTMLHNREVLEAAENAPEGAAFGVDAGDEEEPIQLQSFTDWYNENYDDELMDNIIRYDDEKDRFIITSYRIQVFVIEKPQLPVRGDDLEFMRYWVERKLGEEPPAVAALPAAAQAALNASSLLPLGNY